MATFESREIIRKLNQEGWDEVKRQGKGSHRKFRKQGAGVIIVPCGEIPIGTYRSIARKAGWL